MIHLQPLGDRAWLARFSSEAEARDWAASVRSRQWAGVTEVVLAYDTAAVFAEPDRVDLNDLEKQLQALSVEPASVQPGALHTLPVLYDGEDLPTVAEALGLSRDEVVGYHTGREYDVFAVGFLPGFPYAGYLPESLRGLPRRAEPRARVPAGSVAIVGRQTGVYPSASPGGWHLIGRTPLTIVDLNLAVFPIRAGDRLRFVPIDEAEFDARRGESL